MAEKRVKKRVLIGLTGSVACIKIPEIVEKLKSSTKHDICLISTQSALNFVNIHEFNEIASLTERLDYLHLNDESIQKVITFSDQDEWSSWSKRNDPVLHIELRKWADLFLIAPLDANTLAKLSNGISDNLLTCVARAWDFKKPIIVCPAMNTYMYEHPITEEQLNKLKKWNYEVIEPIEKLLACGDYGKGAMVTVDTIIKKLT